MSPEELVFGLTGINVRLHYGLTGLIRLTVDQEPEKRVKPFLVRDNWQIIHGDDRFRDPWEAVFHFLRFYLRFHAGCEWGPDGLLHNGNQLTGWEHDAMAADRLRLIGEIEHLTYEKRRLRDGGQYQHKKS